jgi:hypothetical protein
VLAHRPLPGQRRTSPLNLGGLDRISRICANGDGSRRTDGASGHHEPVLAAGDAYSYLHLLLVRGISVSAIGRKAPAIRHSERAIVRCS